MSNKKTITITYEGDNTELFWKKNAGESGSRVEVIAPETHFVVAIKDGKYLDTISGGRFVVAKKSRKTVTNTEIVFMSKTYKLRILWGTKNKFSFSATPSRPAFKVGASGEYEVKILSPKQFYLEMVGSEGVYDSDKLKDRLHAKLLSLIEQSIRECVDLYKLTADSLLENKQRISNHIQQSLSRMLDLEYGLKLCGFLITSFVTEICDEYKSHPKTDATEGGLSCNKCGVFCKDSDNFCHNCGTKIGSKTITFDENAHKYCTKCGKNL